MASDIIERWKASTQHQLCLPLLPFTHARFESINADSLNSNFLQLGRRSGGRPQRTVHPRRLPVNTVIHSTHYFSRSRSMVDCWSDALPVVPPTHRLCLIRQTATSIQIRTAIESNNVIYCPAVHIVFPQPKIIPEIVIGKHLLSSVCPSVHGPCTQYV